MGWREDIELQNQTVLYRETIQRLQREYTPELATQLARAYQVAPNMNPEATVSLILGGGDEKLVNDAQRFAVEQMIADGAGRDADRRRNDPETEDDNKSFFESLGDAVTTGLKAVSRSAFTVADSALETVVGTIGAPFSPGARERMKEQGIFDGLIDYLSDIPQATSLWEVGAQFRETGRVDLGSGYFVGGTVETGQAERQRELVGTVERDGQTYAWTPGRGFAELIADVGIIDEDSWAWNVASGLVDATIAITADPTNLIPGVGWGDELIQGVKATGSRRVKTYVSLLERSDAAERAGDTAEALRLRRRALEKIGADIKGPSLRTAGPVETAIRDQLMTEIGMNSGNIRSVDGAQFYSYLTSRSGRKLVERMVGETDRTNIFDLHRGKIGPKIAKDLAEAQTPEEVVGVYLRAFAEPSADLSNMIKAVPDLGLFRTTDMGLWVRRNVNAHVKIGRMMPESSILDISKPSQYIQRLDSLLKVLPTGAGVEGASRYNMKLRQQLLNEAIDTLASGDQASVFALNNKIAGTFADMFLNLGYTPEHVRSLTRWSDEANQYMSFAMNQLASGETADKVPLLVTQLLTSGAAVIDPTELQNVVRQSGWIREQLRTAGIAGKRYANKLKERDEAVSALARAEDAGNETLIRTSRRELDRVNKELGEMKTSEQGATIQLLNGLELMGDFAMSRVWKPLQLIRPAFITRVVGEETLRVLNSGTFGGRGRMLDYIRASFTKNGYGVDAAGRRFRVQVDDFAEKFERRQDLFESLQDARAAGRDDAAKGIQSQIDSLDEELDALEEAVNNAAEFYHQATLANNPGDAYAALTKNPKKMLYQSGQASIVTRTNPGQIDKWVDGTVDRVMKLSADPVLRQYARGGPGSKAKFNVNGVVDTAPNHIAAGRIANVDESMAYWLMDGGGRKYLDKMANAYRAAGQEFNPDNMDDVLGWLGRMKEELRYVTGGKIDPATGRIIEFDEDLMQTIATNRFRGERLQFVDKTRRAPRINDGFRSHVRQYADSPNAPNQMEVLGDSIYGEDKVALMDRIASAFFTEMYGRSSDRLARSPVFRRTYWKQMSQLAGRLTPDEAAKLIEQARKAKLSPKLLERVEAQAKLAKGTATIQQMDDVAKASALAATRDLLFDANKRGATFDQMRLIIPFGDAWKEVMQTWGRLFARQRGTNLYRMLRAGEAAVEADAGPFGPGDLYSVDPVTGEFSPGLDGQREGFIYTDPIAKDKRMMIPWSRQISQGILKAGGLDNVAGVAMGIPIKNMSVAGGILPGIGPVADRIVDTVIPDDPSYDWVRRAVFPFGAPAGADTAGGRQGVEEVALSGWVRKMAAVVPQDWPVAGWLANLAYDKTNDPAYQSTVSQMYSSIMTSGRYSMSFEDQQRAQADAVAAADKIIAFRGLLQGVAPGAPLPTYMARTDEGDVVAALLVEQLRDLEQLFIQRGESPDLALGMILDTYGPDVWLYAAPVSNSQYKGVEATEQYWDFYQRNRSTISQYDLFAGFFGPTGGEFAIEAYGAMQREGVYEIGTPQERYESAARSLGFLAYNRFRDSLPPEQYRTNLDKIMLAQVRTDIEQYFNVDLENAERRSERERQINQAISMVSAADQGIRGPLEMLESPTGEALRVYLSARERMIELANASGVVNWQQAKGAAPFRDVLRSIGARLSADDAGFGKMYQFVFDREMLDDLEVALR